MEHKKTMLDYIADCPKFIRNNVADSAALTKPLVDEYVSGGYKNIWIVACGSSSNGSLCARQFIRRHLKCEVKIVTPFHFVSSENDFSETDMVVVVSQSGYSLNALDAIKVIEAKGRRCIGLTGDVNSDLGKVCDVVANYGVGRETVAYVTRGVTTLALFFMLFAVEAAVRLGIKTAAEGEAVLWEPGCTYELPAVYVKNNGKLALKYKVAITGINGSAKLNEVIDWTINDADLSADHSLSAGATSEALTIKGHMKESAGNDYMNESIDGIAITVVATQNTVESDSFSNTYDANATYPVVAVGDVNTDGDTVIQDREKDPTVIATIPAGSTDAGKLTLVKTEGQTPANIEIVTGTNAVTTEVRLEDQNGNKVTAADGKFFTIALQLEKKLNVIGFYHSETPLTKAESAEAVKAANDTYYYDAATGLLTFSTDDFSPFTVVTSSSVFNGGKGTKANPYLVATGEQALKMEDAKGYFKLVDDIVVTDEIYLSGKTVTVDLNGHSIRLEYAAGVKPNNGSVFYIGGRNGKLTINDSSEGQTGAVYGSDKTYTNKVTSAVRAGNYGRLTINGGHFYGTSEGTSCIFVYTTMSSTSKATVTINGGKFETATPSNGTYYVLNHQDNVTAGCTITVNGGSFKNYNPGVTTVDPVNARTGKITLGAGCTTTSTVDGSDTWYTVSK